MPRNTAYKKKIRREFKYEVLKRDNFSCKVCGLSSEIIVHHITAPDRIVQGGYVKENGISLCKPCELKANQNQDENFSPANLYRLIGSSFELAETEAKKMAWVP